jgi:hypothetical protein
VHRDIINWIKNNKVTAILVLVIIFLLAPKFLYTSSPFLGSRNSYNSLGYPGSITLFEDSSEGMSLPSKGYQDYGGQYAPTPQVQDRMVITNTSLSLLVKDVRAAINRIGEIAISKSGYIVNSRIHSPEEGASGSVSLRVPVTELNSTMEQLRGLSVKVVNENISGRDVTDQYVDIESRLQTLYSVKEIYENMLPQAQGVTQILEVQRHIFQIQDQIDGLTGQQRYLKETSETVLISVNLSTDEYALPYTPDNSWRPEVIFKQAVRSLVSTLRDLGSMMIWLGVYSVLIIPVIVFVYVIRRRRRKNL